MNLLEYFLNVVSVLLIVYLRQSLTSSDPMYICEIDDPKFLGTYAPSRETMDGVPVYSNANDMSIFRNKGFWYVGDLAPWPPETAYRCVEQEGCNYMMDTPPSSEEGAWKPSKKYDKGKVPVISHAPCGSSGAEEL